MLLGVIGIGLMEIFYLVLAIALICFLAWLATWIIGKYFTAVPLFISGVIWILALILCTVIVLRALGVT